MQGICRQGQEGALYPNYDDSKTGRLVMEFLRKKQPRLINPDLTNLVYISLKGYGEDLEVLNLYISKEDIQWLATCLLGTDNPKGID